MLSNADTLEAPTFVIYGDDVGVPEDVRANLCQVVGCERHDGGSTECGVPETWGELREWANE